MKKEKKICLIKNCDRKILCKKLCSTHYHAQPERVAKRVKWTLENSKRPEVKIMKKMEQIKKLNFKILQLKKEIKLIIRTTINWIPKDQKE